MNWGYAGGWPGEYLESKDFDVTASVLKLRDAIARYFKP